MSKIVTVHGTFASGPAEGDKWWQNGSQFEHHILELIESTDGALEVHPFVWDGENSETSRREAGARLYEELVKIEALGRAYCVVGHSHGGSVISEALLNAARQKNELANMQLWLTVGTPFLDHVRRRLRFFRLKNFGKIIYLFWLMLLLFLLSIFISLVWELTNSFSEGALSVLATRGMMIIFATIPLLALIYYLLRQQDTADSNKSTKARKKDARSSFAARWFALRHLEDEAISGLVNLQSFNANLFSNRFAVQPMSLLAICVLPFVFYFGYVFDLASHLTTLTQMSVTPLLEKLSEWLPMKENIYVRNLFTTVSIVVIFVFWFALAVLACVAIVTFVRWLAVGLSYISSGVLNRLVGSQVKVTGFGDDHLGERFAAIGASPPWIANGYGPIPDDLGAELSEIANHRAVGAIARFRSDLSNHNDAREVRDPSSFISESFTGSELIHTAYFDSPRFRKLMAYTIAVAPGFRTTQPFQQDPDFQYAAHWFKEVLDSRQMPKSRTRRKRSLKERFDSWCSLPF